MQGAKWAPSARTSQRSQSANSGEPRQEPEGREVVTRVWPWGTCSPAPHLVPVGPQLLILAAPQGPSRAHSGVPLTSGKSVVAMHFSLPLCYPADPSLS